MVLNCETSRAMDPRRARRRSPSRRRLRETRARGRRTADVLPRHRLLSPSIATSGRCPDHVIVKPGYPRRRQSPTVHVRVALTAHTARAARRRARRWRHHRNRLVRHCAAKDSACCCVHPWLASPVAPGADRRSTASSRPFAREHPMCLGESLGRRPSSGARSPTTTRTVADRVRQRHVLRGALDPPDHRRRG